MQDDPVPERLGEVDAVLRQQAIIADFGTQALQAHDLDQLLTEACRLAADGIGVDHAKVLEQRPDSDRLVVRAGVGWSDGIVGRATLGGDLESPAGYALKTGWPTIAEDLLQETRFRIPDLLRRHDIRAALNVIIRGEGVPFGVLEVDHTSPHRFHQHDVNFLQSFASLLAAAIDRIHAQDSLRNLVQEKTRVARHNEILLRELHHRVNNNLSQIASLIRLQRQKGGSAEVKDALASIESRLSAMMVLYRSLTMSDTKMTVALGAYLQDIAENVRRIVNTPDVNLEIQRTDLIVSLDVAVPLGLIVNEFVTNSFKHAFPDKRGTIRIALHKVRQGLQLILSDDGMGMPSTVTGGLGVSLISRLAEQLGARAEWSGENETRLICHIPNLEPPHAAD